MGTLRTFLHFLSDPLRAVRCARWAALTCVVVLFLQGIAARPTGYLHSWNQISALTVIRQIYREPLSFLQPTGVIARVTTAMTPGSTIDERFLNFQEFPLYHGIAALLGYLGVSLEVAGHLVSILFWALQWGALRRLIRERQPFERLLVDIVYLGSFALTYYGQAIMSDMAMAATGAWAVERAVSWLSGGRATQILTAAFFVVVSSLCKSYGLIFALPVLIIVWPRLGTLRARFVALASLGCVALPVVIWHVYAMFQGGYNELSSHGVANKLHTVMNVRLYKSLWRDYTHFVGLIPGVLALGVAAWSCVRKRNRVAVPTWIAPWLLAIVPYALATLDKLIDHEYYILPFAVPLVALVGMVVAHGVGELSRARTVRNNGVRYRGAWYGALALIVIAIQLTITFRGVYKAQRENPDVTVCAEILRQATQPGDLVAVLSDTQRYNSLAYYADRRGLHVEGYAFSAQRYIDEGARVFLIARDAAEQSEARQWLQRDRQRRFTLIAGGASGADFRGKARLCEVYSSVQK